MVIKLGINGFGRIGRIMFRTCFQNQNVEVTAINDPAIDVEYICYLIKFDSTHGNFNGDVMPFNDDIKINGKVIKIFREKQPFAVPWRLAGVQYVIESSGMFTNYEKAMGHLAGEGVRRVIVTAPSADVPMLILGVNNDSLRPDQKVISSASSTLYCLAPIIKVLETDFGVSEGFVTSIHAMTPSLKPLDGLCLRGKHWRDYRSIHQNIIPATTGACKALGKIMPRLKDKLVGLAFRVPIVNVSVLDLTVRLSKDTSLQKIVESIEKASKTYLKGVLDISYEEAVSSDFIRDSHSCILDINSCIQLRPNFYKFICWYENEYSYACRVIDTILFSERQLYQAQLAKVKNAISVINAKDLKQQVPGSFRQFMSFGSDSSTKTLPNVLRHFSKTFDFKIKSVSHCMPVHRKLPIVSRFSVMNQTTSTNFGTNSKSDIFKIVDYDTTSDSPNLEQNCTGSCFKLKLLKSNKNNKDKMQYRTVKVKNEANEMVNTTLPEKSDKFCQYEPFHFSLNKKDVKEESRPMQSKNSQSDPLERSLGDKEVKEKSRPIQSETSQTDTFEKSFGNNKVKEESRPMQSKSCQSDQFETSSGNKEVKEESRPIQSKTSQSDTLKTSFRNKEVTEESRTIQSKTSQSDTLKTSFRNKEVKEESRPIQSKTSQSDKLKTSFRNKEVTEESRPIKSKTWQSDPIETSLGNKEVKEESHPVQSKICQPDPFEASLYDKKVKEESHPVQSKICQPDPFEASFSDKKVKEESHPVQSKICQPDPFEATLCDKKVKEESHPVQSKICQPDLFEASLCDKEVKEESHPMQSEICPSDPFETLLDNKEVKEESSPMQSEICPSDPLGTSLCNKEVKEESSPMLSEIYQPDPFETSLCDKEVKEESHPMQSEICQSETSESSLDNKEAKEEPRAIQPKTCQFDPFDMLLDDNKVKEKSQSKISHFESIESSSDNKVKDESDSVQSNSENNTITTDSTQDNSESPSEDLLKFKCEGCLVNCKKRELNNHKESQSDDLTNKKTYTEKVIPENVKNAVANGSRRLDLIEDICSSNGIQNEQQTMLDDNSKEEVTSSKVIVPDQASTCLLRTISDSCIRKQYFNSEEGDLTVMKNYEKYNKDDNELKVGNITISKDDIDLDKTLKTTAEYTTKYIIAGKIEDEKVQVESEISRPPCLDKRHCILEKNLPSEYIASNYQENVNIALRKNTKKLGQDIYDKLDSTSATDSDNSFDVNEKQSQVIYINDLTNSLEDLRRLEKICKIIEISDDLSDELFAKLQVNDGTMLANKNWSLKDLCEKISLDDFCNKVFGESNVKVNLC